MKHTAKPLFGFLVLVGIGLGPMTGCVGGYVEAGEPVYYGGEPWVQTDVVVGGGGWYGGHRDNAYVHPDSHRAQSRAAPRESHPAPRQSSSGGKSDDHRK